LLNTGEKQGIFIRIPKTASTSMHYVFDNYPNVKLETKINIIQGKDKQNYRIKFGLANLWRQAVGEKEWDKSISFAFVRNPYDRAVSSWQHVCKLLRKGRFISDSSQVSARLFTRLNKAFLKRAHLPLISGISFDYFLYLQKTGKLIENSEWHACEQHIHVTNPKGEIITTFIGRYENLQKELQSLCEILGIGKVNIPIINASERRKGYKYYYNKERKKIVSEIYQKDIEIFEYSF